MAETPLQKRTIFVLEPVIDRNFGKISREYLERLGFNSKEKGGWRCSLNDDEWKLYRRLTQSGKVQISSGGSLLNSAKTYAQLGMRPIIVIPYELDSSSREQIFDRNFGDHDLVSLGNELPEGEVNKLTVDVFTCDSASSDVNSGERFLLSLDNGKMKYPTLSRVEWVNKLQLETGRVESIVIEGFPFYANEASFANLMSAAKQCEIPVVFCLSNAFKLKEMKAAEHVLNLITEGKISKIVGNDEELLQLLQNNKALLGDSYNRFFTEIEHQQNISDKLRAAKEGLFKHFAQDSRFAKTTFIITRGEKSTLILHDEVMEEVPVSRISKVISTNGAGDAVVAGVMAASSLPSSIPIFEAVKLGHRVASEIIKQVEPNFSSCHDSALRDLKRQLSNMEEFKEPSRSQPPISGELSVPLLVNSSGSTTSDIVPTVVKIGSSQCTALAKRQQELPSLDVATL